MFAWIRIHVDMHAHTFRKEFSPVCKLPLVFQNYKNSQLIGFYKIPQLVQIGIALSGILASSPLASNYYND